MNRHLRRVSNIMSDSKTNDSSALPQQQVFRMTMGKTIAFSIDDLKKELGMNNNGDLMFGGEVVASNLHYFPTIHHPVGTIVSLIYDNGVRTLVPFSCSLNSTKFN